MKLLLKQIEEKWDISELKIISEFKTNGGRNAYKIEAKEGTYVLKMYPPEFEETNIKKYTDALNFISAKSDIKIAPLIYCNKENALYSKINDRYVYIMEYIEGRLLNDTPQEEYKLGQASANIHKICDYQHRSCLDVQERILNMKNRFSEYPFKNEYDEIVNSLPDFDKYKQTFIHTDIGPHNAIITDDEKIIFIDFDDAGMGSLFIDIGYPLITQFVQINKATKVIEFNYEKAKAFYQGYKSNFNISQKDKQLIFDGAVFMQLMYMPCYGIEGIQYMWDILKFALNNKDKLLSTL